MELAKPRLGAIGWVAAMRGGNRGVNGQSAGSRGGKFVAQRCRRRERCRLNEAQAAVPSRLLGSPVTGAFTFWI